MKKEYDFSKMTIASQGKYHKSFRQGYTIKTHQKTGEIAIQYFKPEKGSVTLEPDVLKFFPDAEAVNSVLRSLINLVPAKNRLSTKKVHASQHA